MLKVIHLMVILLASIGTTMISADNSHTFGARLIPHKMIENSNGILQIYSMYNGHTYPQKIDDLVFSSSDSSIIQIGNVNDTGFITSMQIKAISAGTANIQLAAPGYTPLELPIIVYPDNDSPTKLIVKATPSSFSTTSAHLGYYSVELTTDSGQPAVAKNDIVINVASTDTRILTLDDSQITIKSGEYYAVGKFKTIHAGIAQIFASAESFQPASSSISVTASASPKIQAYVYPNKINNYAASTGYVVVQLKDSSGNLMIANEDIPVAVRIPYVFNYTNSTTAYTNSSPVMELIGSHSPLIIKKGTYWGYAPISVNAGISGSFNVTISAPDGYSVSSSGSLTTSPALFLDDKSAKMDTLPILATGNDELIGIIHLEDSDSNPIIANKNVPIEIDSSDPTSLSVDKTIINKGFGAVPVFAKIGTNTPSSLSLHVVTYNDQIITPTITTPSTNSQKLVTEPLISKILNNNVFPLAVYLTDSSGKPQYFSNDSIPNVLPNNDISIETKPVAKGDSIVLLNTATQKVGTAQSTLIIGNNQATVSVTSVDSSTSNLDLDFPEPMLVGSENLMSVQVLDSASNPQYSNQDLKIKFVSGNTSSLMLPSDITIKKGEYFSLFTVNPQNTGSTTISLLTNNLPLAKYTTTIDTMSPDLSIDSPDAIMPNETIFASIHAHMHNFPLKNMNVNWKVTGGTVQNMDHITNSNGTANIVILASSDNNVNIGASVSGLGFTTTSINKISTSNGSNSDSGLTTLSATTGMKPIKINGMDPLPFVVLGTIAVGGILIKKKDLMSFTKKIKQTK